MNKRTGKLLSLLLTLAMVLGMLPAMSLTAFAAGPGITLAGSNSSGTGWSYTESSQTLTLNNYNGGYIQGSGLNTLNLVLEGTSTITVDDANAKGIALENNQSLNISGSGSLTINAAGGSNLIYGIECDYFTMTSGTVTINANSSKMVYGVNANSSLSVTGGKLTANITGTSDGRGLYCKSGKLTVGSGAEVDVTVTNNGSNNMYGIYNEAYTASVTDNGDIELAGTVTITRASGSTGSGEVYGIANGSSGSNTDGVISVTGGSVTVTDAYYGIAAFTKGHAAAFADVDISGGTVNVTSTTSDSLGIVSWNNGVTISGGTVTASTARSALCLFDNDSAQKTGLVKITSGAVVSLTSTNYKALIVDGDESNTSTRVHQINLTSGGSVTVKSTSSDEIYYTYPVQGYFNLGSSTKITEGSFRSATDGTNAGGGKLFQSDDTTKQVVVAYSTPAPTSIIIAYSGENRVGLNSSSGYYLVNGAAAASGTLGSDGCTAYYNESTGTLYLNGFNGGAISVYGSNNKKLTIDLTGTNHASTLDNGSGNGCIFEITSSTNGKLIIDSAKEKGTIIGINTGSTSGDTTGSVILSGSADVSVTLRHSGEENIDNYAHAIYANEGIEIKDSASFTAKLKTKTSGPDRANGLYLTTKASGSKIVINTTGNVSIDTSEDTANYSTPIYSSSPAGEVKLQNVGKMTLKYKKYSTYGKDSYPDVTYATEDFTKNSVEEANIITTTYEAAAAACTVTVQNDGNGSGSATPATAAAGTEITLSATANSGYHFKEWQVVSGSVTIIGNKFTMPASDVTVKAIFEANASGTYTVSFNANGGSVTPASAVTGADGKLTSLPTPTRSGYTFNGWYTATSGGTKVDTNYIFSADTTIYAQWTPVASTISITSDPSKTYDGAAVTDPTVNKTGSTGTVSYTYYTNAACTTETTTADGAASNGAAPKNAGNYWVKATVAADANYGSATSEAKAFTISPKSINGANITLGTQATYNGSEQPVTISKVEVGGSTLTLDTDYTVTSGSKATNVGNTTLTITGKGNYTGTATKTWSLQKATPTAADFTLPTDLTKNYTGSPITVSAPMLKSGKTGAGTITVKYADSATAPTDVGSYTVTFDVAEGQNYKEATGLSIGMLTINKVNYTGTKTASATVRSGQTTANATLTLPALPTGASYAASGTVGGTSALISSHSISGTTLTYSTTSQADNTSATITIGVTGATNYNNYEVVVTVTAKNKDAATVSLTGTVPTSKTYGDANFNVTASAEHTEAGGAWTWTSSNESVLKVTGTSTTGTVQVVGQGSATITAKYESANYLGEAASASITVNKKNVTITGLSASSKEYDGNTTATVSGTAVVSGKVGSDDVTVTAGSAAFADKNVGSGKTVTFTGYTLSGAKAGNYNLTDQPASVTANITTKDVTITGVTATTRAYVSGNKGVALTGGTVTGAVSGDTVTVDLTNATGTMTDEDAGTNKAVAVTGVALGGTDKGNYHLTAQPTGVTVTISKATYASSITANKNVKTNTPLTGVEVDMSAKFGVIKGAAVKSAAENSDTDNIIDNVSVSGNIVKFDVASVAAADKTATINVVISCTNFEDITAVLTVKTVDKDEAGVTISGVPTEAKTYGDADLTLTGAVTAAGTGTGNWTWEASDPTVLQITGTGNTAKVKLLKAGSATVTAKYESDTTIGQLTTANIRVNKATVTVTAKDQSIYVNGTAPDLTSPVKDTHYTVTGLASGDTLGGTIAMKYQKDGSDAAPDVTKTGTYDIVISGATAPAGGNYNDVVFAKGTLTIASRPSSGGGSSSGSSGSTITVPVSDPKNQIKVTASVSGSTATVQKMDLSKIDPAQGATIDFTGLGKTIESAKLPTSAIKEIGATEGGTLTVKLTAGNVTFDTAALKAVADQAGSQITLTLTPAKTSALNASQKEAVGDAPVFDLRLLGGSKAITDFKGGNVTVTLPHTLSEGQNPAGVVAYYLSNDGNPEACKTTYDTKNKLVTFTTTHFSLYFVGYEQPAAEWKNPFTDVAEGAWYFDSVKYVHSEGMMVGTSATKFSPDATTTRGMVVTILYRLEGEPAVSGKSTFADVVGTAWYANAVEWAAKNKIVDGYGNGKFGPEDVITREQMVAILYRYAAFKGLDMTKTADLSKFTDSGKISSWAKPALSWANAEGLISGKSGGVLDPLGTATRAEVATILRNFCEK